MMKSPMKQKSPIEALRSLHRAFYMQSTEKGAFMNTTKNEIKAQIIRAGFTMQEVCDRLHDDYGWSDSVSNLSNKLRRESFRFREEVELADVLGYDIVWQRRKER